MAMYYHENHKLKKTRRRGAWTVSGILPLRRPDLARSFASVCHPRKSAWNKRDPSTFVPLSLSLMAEREYHSFF